MSANAPTFTDPSRVVLRDALVNSINIMVGPRRQPQSPGFQTSIPPLASSPPHGSYLNSPIQAFPEERLMLAKLLAERQAMEQHSQAVMLQQQLLAQRQNLLMHRAVMVQPYAVPKIQYPSVQAPTTPLNSLLAAQYAQEGQGQVRERSSSIGYPETERRTKALVALGSHRRGADDPYIDISALADAPKNSVIPRKSRGGVNEPFPEKLYRMLEDLEGSNIATFLPHGRAFVIHRSDKFVNEILPKYFKMSKWSSFARQLNLYGFNRIQSGRDIGGYYHELFLKGRPHLCEHMRRVGVPSGKEDRRKVRNKETPSDPDFYNMRPL